MDALSLPFLPIRPGLYSTDELFSAFSDQDNSTYAKTLDLRIFAHFVRAGRSAPTDSLTSIMQALHDNTITQHLNSHLLNSRVIALMGGHKLGRDNPAFTQVAKLTRELTRANFLVTSGGGPGAMEASHLGAAYANSPDADLDGAITLLKSAAALPPNVAEIVSVTGVINPEIAASVHAWYAPALRLFRSLSNPGKSLAVPTWHYGHEPSTPFATSIGKYFQNSIREEGLLAIAKHGVIYAQGKAGTIQEIYQDAAQNYYRTFGWISPMVFFDKKYWTETFPVLPVLKALFGDHDFNKYVLTTDDVAETVQFIQAFAPPA